MFSSDQIDLTNFVPGEVTTREEARAHAHPTVSCNVSAALAETQEKIQRSSRDMLASSFTMTESKLREFDEQLANMESDLQDQRSHPKKHPVARRRDQCNEMEPASPREDLRDSR